MALAILMIPRPQALELTYVNKVQADGPALHPAAPMNKLEACSTSCDISRSVIQLNRSGLKRDEIRPASG
jgi:hypothetical protein